jgi:hypothetical protein
MTRICLVCRSEKLLEMERQLDDVLRDIKHVWPTMFGTGRHLYGPAIPL